MILTTPEELQQLISEAVKLALHESPVHSSPGGASDKSYLTISEAAEYLNLAKQTLYTFTSTRAIPFIKRAKRLLFVKNDLDAWLAEGKKRSMVQLRNSIQQTGRVV